MVLITKFLLNNIWDYKNKNTPEVSKDFLIKLIFVGNCFILVLIKGKGI